MAMNDLNWVASLLHAKAATKYEFLAIHVLAPFRDLEGVAPVVLQTQDKYLRAPAYMEAAFELCLRHLHGSYIPGPDKLSPQAMLATCAVEAMKLPGRYLPTIEGNVIDMEPRADQNGERCAVEEPGSTEYSPTTVALDAEAEQIVEPLAPSIDGDQNDQAIKEELRSAQLANAAALDLSDTEAEPIAGEPLGTKVDVVSAVKVDRAPSTLSKKARRRAARKAFRRHP